MRNDEAEAADAAGAEALADKLGCSEDSSPAAQPVQASPFAKAQEQQPQPQQSRVKRRTSFVSRKKSGCAEDGNLGTLLLDSGGDVTGTEAATAREAAWMELERQAEAARSCSLDGSPDAVIAKAKAGRELPPLCARARALSVCLPRESGYSALLLQRLPIHAVTAMVKSLLLFLNLQLI